MPTLDLHAIAGKVPRQGIGHLPLQGHDGFTVDPHAYSHDWRHPQTLRDLCRRARNLRLTLALPERAWQLLDRSAVLLEPQGLSVDEYTMWVMRLTPISGYTDRNGRRVGPYKQRRREAAPESDARHTRGSPHTMDGVWGGRGLARSPSIAAAQLGGVAAAVVMAGWAVWHIAGQVRELTHDRLEDSAPLASSSWFATAGVVCEASRILRQRCAASCPIIGDWNPLALTRFTRSRWYGTIVALRAGNAPQWVCANRPLTVPSPIEPLDAGQTATFRSTNNGILTCQALSNGSVNCRHHGSHYGFEFGPSGYRFDGGIFDLG